MNAHANLAFDAIFWDCDGTLADSEPVHDLSFECAAKDIGLSLPEGFHEEILGRSDHEAYGLLVTRYGLELGFQDWLTRRFSVYLSEIERVTPFVDAMALWHRAAQLGVRQAIVSNSDRLLLSANLQRLGLNGPQLVSVSRNDVREGKPSPEAYLRAAHLLDVDPSRAAAVEDSATGRAAAEVAGLTVFMAPSFKGADRVLWLDDLAEHISDAEEKVA